MRRSGLTKVRCFRWGWDRLLTVLLAWLLPLWATGAAVAQTDERGDAWLQASLQGLDQRVQAIVERPTPATLKEAAPAARVEETGGHVEMLLVGPRRSSTSTSTAGPAAGITATVPAPAASGVVEPSVHASASVVSASATIAEDVEAVFGDVVNQISPSSEAPLPDAEERLANRSSRDESVLGREPAEPAPPTPPAPRVIPQHVAPLQPMIEQCLQAHAPLRLNSGQDSCWSIMHAFLGWGPGCEIHVGGARGPRTNAMAWVAQNQPCGGRRLFYLEANRIRGRQGPGYQGHPAQFLAMMAQCGMDPSFPMRVNDRNFTLADLIEEEKRTCTSSTELTFKLIGLAHYLGTDAQWVNDAGEPWDIPKILAIELAQPVNGAACGGTHRLMAISYAVAKRRQEGGAMDGHWWRAEKYIADYHVYTLTLQNRDGSFSSDWFRQRADWGDMNRRIQTTGHMLEWLAFSLPEESLYDPRVVHAVHYLARTMVQHRYHDWEVGPKGHAIRALRLYYERVFQQQSGGGVPLAEAPAAAAR